MTNVKSNYSGPLGLPGGPVIPPGGTVAVEKWPTMQDHTVVKSWLAAGVIEVEEAGPVGPDLEAKDAVIAQLVALGVESMRDAPLADLQKALQSAQQQQADAEAAEAAEKDDLIAKLDALGVKKTRRSSVESLQKALEEAQSDADETSEDDETSGDSEKSEDDRTSEDSEESEDDGTSEDESDSFLDDTTDGEDE